MSWSARVTVVSMVSLGILLSNGAPVLSSPSTGAIPEDELLDIGIVVPDPGVEKKSYLLTGYEYVITDLRDSEAVFIAVHLMRTLQETERFGLVRVMPSNSISADLFIDGRIRESSGRRLALELEVVDATGRRWLKRTYKHKARPSTYAFAFHANLEPFQELYDEIAADLIKTRARMKAEHLENLRRIAELRFAARLAPGIFDGYLSRDRRGRLELDRLPSVDDPMLERLRAIQLRDEFFLDLLTERYQGFYRSMDRPYDDFRATRYDVEIALSKARAQSILANARLAYQPVDDSYHATRDVRRQLDFFRHQVAAQATYLDEIASAFATDMEPLKLELDGEVIRFEGTIEDQYRQWQELLEKIFEAETGMSAKTGDFGQVRGSLN